MIRLSAYDYGLQISDIVDITRSSPIEMGQRYMELTVEMDNSLGLCDDSRIEWRSRTDYTGEHLPHYLNHFMLHIIEGYLETGEY